MVQQTWVEDTCAPHLSKLGTLAYPKARDLASPAENSFCSKDVACRTFNHPTPQTYPFLRNLTRAFGKDLFKKDGDLGPEASKSQQQVAVQSQWVKPAFHQKGPKGPSDLFSCDDMSLVLHNPAHSKTLGTLPPGNRSP